MFNEATVLEQSVLLNTNPPALHPITTFNSGKRLGMIALRSSTTSGQAVGETTLSDVPPVLLEAQ